LRFRAILYVRPMHIVWFASTTRASVRDETRRDDV